MLIKTYLHARSPKSIVPPKKMQNIVIHPTQIVITQGNLEQALNYQILSIYIYIYTIPTLLYSHLMSFSCYIQSYQASKYTTIYYYYVSAINQDVLL